MRKHSVYEAKAHFSELVERAEAGLSTIITKRGRVVARIVPATEGSWDRTAILEEAEAVRKSLAVDGSFGVADLMEDGRL